jgi:metallo-beta-lactamase family protein
MHLTFLGATQTVTGSRYLLECAERRVLVDCGLFQGYKYLRQKNWQPLPLDAARLDAVILTHAHLDHSGYLPALMREGYRGPVYATRATAELCGILLPDSGHLQEEQAQFANRHRFSKHSPALPLYTQAEAESSLDLLRRTDFDKPFVPMPGVTAQFSRAGHLLGAASVRIEHAGRSILFSGDIGRPDDPLMPAPAPPPHADHVVIESTYGDRTHPAVDPQVQLRDLILKAIARGGIILVPTFAVGRAQLLMLLIARLKAAGEIPDVPMYLDSPMAIDATDSLLRFPGEHRLNTADIALLRTAAIHVHTPGQSRMLDAIRQPTIILAASGMATGGRILHHLKVFMPDARNLIVFAGFQAGGTRGAAMIAGARTVRIHGEEFPVNAEVAALDTLSAHADAPELMAWLSRMPSAPRNVFITHGEPPASDALRQRIDRELHWHAVVPEYRDRIEL